MIVPLLRNVYLGMVLMLAQATIASPVVGACCKWCNADSGSDDEPPIPQEQFSEQVLALVQEFSSTLSFFPQHASYWICEELSNRNGLVLLLEESSSRKRLVGKILLVDPAVRNSAELIDNEISFQQSCASPFVVPIIKVIKDQKLTMAVFPYLDAGNLETEIKARISKSGFVSIPENSCREACAPDRVLQVALPLAWAIRHMHCVANIAHRDIKLGNILLAKDGRVLLADFGLAIKCSDTLVAEENRHRSGTPCYMAPEILNKSWTTTSELKKSDMWSLGIALHRLAVSHYPFWGQDLRVLTSAILNARYEAVSPTPCGPEFTQLLCELLVKNPAQRLAIDDMLGHAYCRKYFPNFIDAMVRERSCPESLRRAAVEMAPYYLTPLRVAQLTQYNASAHQGADAAAVEGEKKKD